MGWGPRGRSSLRGAGPAPGTRRGGDVGEPALSPDGGRIAFAFYPREDLDRSEICLVAASGGGIRRLTGNPRVSDHRPRWSPDGRQLAFLSDRSGWHELYRIDAAGGPATPLTHVDADVMDFAWSPDGQRIGLLVNPEGNARLQ